MDENNFDVSRIFNVLMTHPRVCYETDKAMTDALRRGAGYLRVTICGVQYVPFDDVRITLSAGDSNG